jgi:hypothetical protein
LYKLHRRLGLRRTCLLPCSSTFFRFDGTELVPLITLALLDVPAAAVIARYDSASSGNDTSKALGRWRLLDISVVLALIRELAYWWTARELSGIQCGERRR